MISLSSETSVERSNSSSLDVHDDIIHPFLIYLKSLSVIDLFPVAQINISEVSSNFRYDMTTKLLIFARFLTSIFLSYILTFSFLSSRR